MVAQSYLEHQQEEHPEELKKERAKRPVLREVQEHLLIRSDRASTGYKGVQKSTNGRYYVACYTPPCHHHLGTFDTPEEAAQTYLQHQQKEHPEELKKERVPRPVLLRVCFVSGCSFANPNNSTGEEGDI